MKHVQSKSRIRCRRRQRTFESLEPKFVLASISGFVYGDLNMDGVRDADEAGVPGVQITLTGNEASGRSVRRTAITTNTGFYTFDDLSAGIYDLTETHPAVMDDGIDSTEFAGAVPADDQITNIALGDTQDARDNNFGETRLRPSFISIVWFFSSTASNDDTFRKLVAAGEEQAGNTELAAAILNGNTVRVNSPPIAVADSYDAVSGSPLNVSAGSGVLANDLDADGDTLTATRVSEPINGSLILNPDGSFVYTPAPGSSGVDSFTYTVSDASTTSSAATVTINVSDDHDASPIAVNDSYSVPEDSSISTTASNGLLANDSDADGDMITAELIAGPNDGELSFSADGSFVYTPNNNFHGTDAFTYRATDGMLTSAPATVTILVESVNDPPSAVSDEYTVDEDANLSKVRIEGVLANDFDIEDDQLTVTLASGPFNGSLTLDPDGSFDYEPTTDFNGTDTFTYVATDGVADSEETTVTIMINAVNDAPVSAGDLYSLVINEASTLVVDDLTGVLANDTDVDGDSLLVVLVSDVAHGNLALQGDGSFEYTPDPDFVGADSFSYMATDGLDNSLVATVSINVTSFNNSPISVNDEYIVDEDTELTTNESSGVLSNDTDPDGDTLFAEKVSDPLNGTLVFHADGSFEYTPNPNFHGVDSFTYIARDGSSTSTGTTVTVAVDAVNDTPETMVDTYTTNEGETLTVPAPGILANDSDIDGDALSAVRVTDPANGTLTLNADGSFTYIPNTDFFGIDSFTYTANDAEAASSPATVEIAVNFVGNELIATNDAYEVNQDDALTIDDTNGVLSNDTDLKGDQLTAQLAEQAANGIVVLELNGSFTYTPNPGFSGLDSFTYTVSDESGSTDSGTVTIDVKPVVTVIESTILSASKDNTLYETANADGSLSNGSGETLYVGQTRTNNSHRLRRGLIAFEVHAAVPAGAVIKNVGLTLRLSRTHPAIGERDIDLHLVTADWGEGGSIADVARGGAGAPSATDDATWLHTFYSSQTWTNPGGDFDSSISGTTFVNGPGFYEWSSPQMVVDVQSWLDDPTNNFGWMLLGDETMDSVKQFDSRENSDPANRPQLSLEYEMVSGAAEIVSSAAPRAPSAITGVEPIIVVESPHPETNSKSLLHDGISQTVSTVEKTLAGFNRRKTSDMRGYQHSAPTYQPFVDAVFADLADWLL